MFTEPLAALFVDWGELATWSGGRDVMVIFDNDYVDVLGQFEGRGPAATVALSDMPGVDQGQTLTIRSTVYTIVEVRPDTVGATAVLRLRT